MRRDPRIINLYDRPLYARPSYAAHRYVAPRGGGAPVLASATIIAVVGIFFWAYDAIAHRDPLAIPEFMPAAGSQRGAAYQPAPAPDMKSEAVTFANADAPQHVRHEKPKALAIAPQGNSAVAAQDAKRAAASSLSGEAAQAFALANTDRGVARYQIKTHGF